MGKILNNHSMVMQKVAASYFCVVPNALYFDADTYLSDSVCICSSGSWTASEALSWVSLSSTSGTGSASITISASVNRLETPRSGNVCITSNSITCCVSVFQYGFGDIV